MQKYSSILKITILILISISSGQSEYCNARANQDNLYLKFEKLVQNEQNTKAIEIGDDLFEKFVSKYSKNVSLHDVLIRFKAVHDIIEVISKGFESRQRNALDDIVALDILPEHPPIGKNEGESHYGRRSGHWPRPGMRGLPGKAQNLSRRRWQD